MKVCPECDTQYEDHVLACLVDGAALVPSARGISQTQTMPIPVPPARPVHVAPPPEPRHAERTMELPAVPPPRRSAARWLLVVPPLAALVLGVVVVAAYAVWVAGSQRATAAAVPAPALPPPSATAATTPPDPVPDEEPAPELVRFDSDPPGAEVWENDTLVCMTPCTIEHPAHVPLPRSFVLRANGFRDTPWTLDDPSRPQLVELARRSTKTTHTQKPAPGQPRPRLFGAR
jgi:hypothetical protein